MEFLCRLARTGSYRRRRIPTRFRFSPHRLPQRESEARKTGRSNVACAHNIQVPDTKPVLLWDGQCGFCKIWVDYWKQLTGDRIEYRTSQEAGSEFPQINPRTFSQSVQLVRPDGSVASGARAVFESQGMLKTYESSRVFAAIAEWAYRFIAGHRDLFYQVTRFTFGRRIEPARFWATQWIFLRALAVIYAVAFGSMAVQISGLIGTRGILPLGEYMDVVSKALGPSRWRILPMVFWWGDWSSEADKMLIGFCWLGVFFAFLLLFGRMEKLLLAILFVMYLSLCSAGQDFMGFQWDALLLEAGFLAIFLGRARIVAWLFRWLAFRLYFLSGAVKLLSHDPSWRNLSALDFHYHTQPLPTIFAWYMDKLPAGVQRASTLVVLARGYALSFTFIGGTEDDVEELVDGLSFAAGAKARPH